MKKYIRKNYIKNRVVGLLVVGLCILTSGLSAMQRVRLVGIGSDFTSSIAKHRPSIRVTKIAGVPVSKGMNPLAGHSTLQTLNANLPVEITIKYPDRNREYIIVVDKVAYADRLPCHGANPITVGANISPLSGTFSHNSKVCLSVSETMVPNSVVRSGDFNGVALFLKPNPLFEATDISSSLPFTFGLSAWTSDQAPWTAQKLSESTSSIGQEDTRDYTFSPDPETGEPGSLTIFQGFGGLGGGQIPRQSHAAIGHIFNDTDDIVLISRQSSNPALAQFDYSQMIPPKSVFPYTMFWIPKIANKDELAIAQHDGIRIALLAKRPKTPPLDYGNFFTRVADLGTNYAVPIPRGYQELLDLMEENTQQADEEAAEILGVSQWQQAGDYPELSVANHYYMISTDAKERKTYLQKCALKTDRCKLTEQSPVGGEAETAYTPSGLPSYYNLIIKKNQSEFEVEMYKTTLRPPYKY
jgi:hypothetical protein